MSYVLPHTDTNFKPNHLCSLAPPSGSAINKEIKIQKFWLIKGAVVKI